MKDIPTGLSNPLTNISSTKKSLSGFDFTVGPLAPMIPPEPSLKIYVRKKSRKLKRRAFPTYPGLEIGQGHCSPSGRSSAVRRAAALVIGHGLDCAF